MSEIAQTTPQIESDTPQGRTAEAAGTARQSNARSREGDATRQTGPLATGAAQPEGAMPLRGKPPQQQTKLNQNGQRSRRERAIPAASTTQPERATLPKGASHPGQVPVTRKKASLQQKKTGTRRYRSNNVTSSLSTRQAGAGSGGGLRLSDSAARRARTSEGANPHRSRQEPTGRCATP